LKDNIFEIAKSINTTFERKKEGIVCVNSPAILNINLWRRRTAI